MSDAPRRWQPVGPTLLQETEAVLNAQLRRLSATWLTEGSFMIADLKPLSPRQVSDIAGHDWRLHNSGMATRFLPTAKGRLINRALDLADSGSQRSHADTQLMDRFHERMVEDLLRILTSGFAAKTTAADIKASPRFDAGGGVRGWIKDSTGAQYGEVAIPVGLILAASKAGPDTQKSNPKRLSDALIPRRTAWGTSLLSLEACLGSAQISYGELQSLAPGDVLVLDRSLDQLIALTLKGSTEAVATGSLCRSGNLVALHINNPDLKQPNSQSPSQ